MRTSIIEKHIFFESSIFKVGLLSELYRSKSSRFHTELSLWLSENETVLKQFGFSESSQFSLLRNQLFATNLKRTSLKRKQQFLIMGECLEKAHEILTRLYDPIKAKIEQGKETVQQVLIIIQETPEFAKSKKEDFNNYIKRIWSVLKKNAQFKSITIQLRTILPEVDILRIIAEKIEL